MFYGKLTAAVPAFADSHKHINHRTFGVTLLANKREHTPTHYKLKYHSMSLTVSLISGFSHYYNRKLHHATFYESLIGSVCQCEAMSASFL